MPLGYWLRFRAPVDPTWRDHTGGAVYVILWVVLFALIRPRSNPALISTVVLAITCTLEFLQLWHPPALEAARSTFAGRVLLGTTFDWGDFPSYFIGAFLAWALIRSSHQLH